MKESMMLAKVCRQGAIELLKRAQSVLDAGGCGCADLPGEEICDACQMQHSLECEINQMEDVK